MDMPVPDAVAAIEALFNPTSITILGASESYAKWGNIIPGNILAGGYQGRLNLVNPRGGSVHGIPVYRSVEEIPEKLDLVMMAIPAEAAEGMLPACGRAGAKVAIVISGGFSESSTEGRELEKKMIASAHASGMRIVGPNTMGIYTAPQRLTALMPAVRPLPGGIAFAAQSGNLGTQMLGFGAYRGVGFSRFVCIGNESDLDFVDYLEYFDRDEATSAILLYVEGFKNPRRFFNSAREISTRKPIVIYKAGGTRAGGTAAASHSAAMAGSQEVYQGMINQLGLAHAEGTEEMLDISDALVKMPLPRGGRVAILTWGGGWGVVTADLCERAGLSVVPLPEEIKKSFDGFLPSYWSKGNPVDLVGVFDIDSHVECLKQLAASDAYDAVISLGTINANVSFQEMMGRDWSGYDEAAKEAGLRLMQAMTEKFMATLVGLIEKYGKPILTVGMPQKEEDMSNLPAGREKICVYSTPEQAVRVMSALVRRAAWLRGLERGGKVS